MDFVYIRRISGFFQYSPFNEQGGIKFRGHYKSTDLLNWTYLRPAIYADQPFDCHGAYSGSTLVEEDKMIIYYTGNVKLAGLKNIRILVETSCIEIFINSGETVMTTRFYPEQEYHSLRVIAHQGQLSLWEMDKIQVHFTS